MEGYLIKLERYLIKLERLIVFLDMTDPTSWCEAGHYAWVPCGSSYKGKDWDMGDRPRLAKASVHVEAGLYRKGREKEFKK